MKRKISTGDAILGTIIALFVIGFLWLFPYQAIKYFFLPEHKVYVEWTVYSASGPLEYKGTYEMRGDTFGSSRTSSRGSNYVDIENRGDCSLFVGNQRVCIYSGTNEVDVNLIKIVE